MTRLAIAFLVLSTLAIAGTVLALSGVLQSATVAEIGRWGLVPCLVFTGVTLLPGRRTVR
jgi:hypothetical protein